MAFRAVKHAVIVAPHPDDEVIGAFGLIRALRVVGARVRVVLVTDGTGSHPASFRWPPRRLAARRRRETLTALRGIGVDKAEVTFLGLPDGGLASMSAPQVRLARRRIAIAIALGRGSGLLVTPARDDDHPDHRAVAAIARRVPAGRRLEYLVWPGRAARSRPPTHGLRLGHAAVAKRGAILRYRSQTGGITDDPGGFVISRKEIAAFSHPVERYREVRR